MKLPLDLFLVLKIQIRTVAFNSPQRMRLQLSGYIMVDLPMKSFYNARKFSLSLWIHFKAVTKFFSQALNINLAKFLCNCKSCQYNNQFSDGSVNSISGSINPPSMDSETSQSIQKVFSFFWACMQKWDQAHSGKNSPAVASASFPESICGFSVLSEFRKRFLKICFFRFTLAV